MSYQFLSIDVLYEICIKNGHGGMATLDDTKYQLYKSFFKIYILRNTKNQAAQHSLNASHFQNELIYTNHI